MALYRGPKVVTDGLILALDASDKTSYPGSGTTWTDLTGYNNNGTLTNDPLFSSSNTGNIYFNGTDNYVVKSSFNTPPTATFTFNLWCAFITNTTDRYLMAFGRDIGVPTGGTALIAYGFDVVSDAIIFEFGSGVGRVSSGLVPTLNTWYNLCVTADGVNTKFYVNGVLQNTASQGSGVITSSPVLSLGSYVNSGGTPSTYFHSGHIASCLIYNRALNSSEILQNYNAVRSRFETAPSMTVTTQKAIFGYGNIAASPYVTAVTNLVSNTGVVATDTTGVGTARYRLAATGYSVDKAIFGYGDNYSTYVSMTNLVSNTGVVSTDTTGVGTARDALAAAKYGFTKAIFGYGRAVGGGYSLTTNLISNTGVVATDVSSAAPARPFLAAAGYGGDKAIFGKGLGSGAGLTQVNLVSNTGVVASATSTSSSPIYALAGTTYGNDKAIFGYGYYYGSGNIYPVATTNLISNTGVVASDTTGVGYARGTLGAAVYGGDKAIFGYGDQPGYSAVTNLVSNTGVVATDTAGVGTARQGVAAAGYSST